MASPFVAHIALTGGIGSGKSSVAAYLAGHGWRVLDADLASRQLVAPGEAGWRALREEFGASYFQADGTLDRPRLRRAIFADERLRLRVNAILHPLVRAELARQVAAAEGAPKLLEIPLLFETGWQDDFAAVLVVFADEESCLARIMARDGVSRSQALAALAAQIPLATKAGWADYLIDNSGDWSDTCRQLEQLTKIWREKWGGVKKCLDSGRRKK